MPTRTLQRTNALVYTAILTAVLVYAFVLVPKNYFEVPRLKTQDLFFRAAHALRPLPKEVNDIAIVSIDDESLSLINQKWPWEREHYAYLIEQLLSARPKVIAFDIVFLGKSVNARSDAMFATTLAKAGNVILAGYRAENGAYVKPYTLFAQSSAGFGLINKPRDADNLVRNTRLWMREVESQSILDYTFETKTICRYLEMGPEGLNIQPGKATLAAGLTIPLRKDDTFLVNYIAKPGDFTTIPIWRIIKGQFNARDLEGKIVIVGQANEIIHDVHPTPLGRMPGAAISANVMLTVLSHRFLREIPPVQSGMELLLFALLTFLICVKLDLVKGLLTCAGLLGLYGAYALFLFRQHWVGDFFSIPVFVPAIFIILQFQRSVSLFIENLALKHDAITDGLTGLYLHKYLVVRLANELERARRYEQDLSVALIDIDFFKKFNDSHGHEEGNRALQHFSKILQESFRKVDLLFRYGGEEFCVVLPGGNPQSAFESVERFRKKLESTPLAVGEKSLALQASIGLVSFPQTGIADVHEMLEKADKGLYEAKRSGRNRTCIYPPETTS